MVELNESVEVERPKKKIVPADTSPGIDKMGRNYEPARKKAALDCGMFHQGCTNVTVVPSFGGVGFRWVCIDCRVCADAEAIGVAITPGSACEPRTKKGAKK